MAAVALRGRDDRSQGSCLLELNADTGLPSWMRIEIGDNGLGGADLTRGSGLSGPRDRIQALDGRLRIESPNGGGTRLIVEIPCE